MSLALLLATELQVDLEAGFDVTGVSAPGPYVAAVEALGVRHEAVPSLTRRWDPRRDAAALRDLVRVLRRLRPDVVHTHTPKAGVFGRIAARLARVPVVVNTCHGLWVRPEDSLAKKAAVYGAEAMAAQFSHAELYQNEEDRHALRWFVPRARSRLVGNGVDLDRFRFDAAGRARVRNELGIAADVLLVGGVGRRVKEKGLEELGMAARALSGRAHFVWVGPEDTDKSDRAGSIDGVEFLPERTDMAAFYSALDIFVLPSHREGLSRSAMEAAACARPMVLTDIRGCRQIGDHERHLLLVPVRDPAALRVALERLLNDASLRTSLGEAARARANEEFDQRQVAQASIDVYREVLARQRRP